MKRGIVLTGMMGAGKTTVGRLLAQRLGLPFFDCDEAFAEAYGAISDYFDKFGEDAFRDKESEIIAGLSEASGTVIATGGGAVLRGGNIEKLKKNNYIILLYADTAELDRRLAGGADRPLYSAGKLSAIWQERRALYDCCADFKIDTGARSPLMICTEIEKLIKQNAAE